MKKEFMELKKRFNVGDLVCVAEGVHDDKMPKNNRYGLVVETVGKKRDQCVVMFMNGSFLKFHACQLFQLTTL